MGFVLGKLLVSISTHFNEKIIFWGDRVISEDPGADGVVLGGAALLQYGDGEGHSYRP